MHGARRWLTLGLGLLTVMVSLPGCARRSALMPPGGGDASAVRPEPNRALVMFLRPGRYGGAIQAAVYDGESLIGISSSGTAIPYQAAPGRHLFMVVSEAADFLDADL